MAAFYEATLLGNSYLNLVAVGSLGHLFHNNLMSAHLLIRGIISPSHSK